MPEDTARNINSELIDPPITGWAKEPSVSDLKQNYDDAKADQAVWIDKLQTWRDNLYVEGSAKIKTKPGNSKHVPKLIRKQAEWRYPGLSEPFLTTEDVFNVNPRTKADVERAKQNQLVLNYQFNTQIDKVTFIDDYVRAVVDEGTAIVRVGWETHEEEVTRSEPIYTLVPDTARKSEPRYTFLAQLMQNDPETAKQYLDPGIEMALQQFIATQGALVSIPRITGYEQVTELKETVNRPSLDVCELENLVVDPTCGRDISKAAFVIYSYETSLSELKKEKGKYKNLDKINLEAGSAQNDAEYSGNKDIMSFAFLDDPRKKITVYEYWGNWDIDGSGLTKPIVAAWVGSTKIRMEENPYPDRGIPFVSVPYRPKRRSFRGEPDGELLEENQKIIGALTRGIIDVLAKSANGQTGMRKDLLDITNRRKYNRGEDYEFNQIADPRQAIYSHVYPEIPSSAYNLLNMMHAEAESLSGTKAFYNGISGDSFGQVAAGVRGTLDATSVRDSSILRRLVAGMIKIGRKIVSMNAEFLSDEETIRITDEEFVTVRRDDLPGNYDIKLAVSTAEEDNKRAEELAFMLQTMGNTVDPQLVLMVLADIARLRRMPRLADKLENYKPQPDPMAQQKMKLEMEELMSKIQKNYAEAQLAGMDAQFNRAKIITEQTVAVLNQAKTRALGSAADLDDLEYLEQESGVHQERELQRLGAQAKAQGQTKIIEAALKAAQPSSAR